MYYKNSSTERREFYVSNGQKMRKEINSDQHNYSWFRDQVLHPHETQHTLKEVCEWLKEFGFKLKTTSIGKYDSNSSLDKLFEKEITLSDYSYSMNFVKKEFYPGYFTVCAQKI